MATLPAGLPHAKHLEARLAAFARFLPHRPYAPGDRCPMHPTDRFFPVPGASGRVFCPDSGVTHPWRA